MFYNSLISTESSEYAPTIWHKMCVPKHRFICWQAINDYFLTRDHLSRVMEITNKKSLIRTALLLVWFEYLAEGLQALEGLVFEDDEELAGKGDKRCHDCYSVFLMAE
ncbi:hypothetical protein F8388_012695 [Cannabis sativa]|uniref:Reverse transcriptase zinc-binding domain-containing protein n=1 Tax=Cannabis sativa TaxID=3483 RepID=A0A7J6HCL7_CANSA|nr:hypothetical protein F8388_012695 [Cannabis sativa]